MSKPKGKVVQGDEALELVGLRMSSAQVARLNELREASKTRALSSREENELWNLEQKNKLRTRYE